MRRAPVRRLVLALVGPSLVLLVGLSLALLAGCAPLALGPAPAPVPAAQAPAPANGAGTATPDSTPSRDALRVLASIPEPIAAGDRIPAPDRATLPAPRDTATRHMLVPASAYDTLRLAPSSMMNSMPDSMPDSMSDSIPVPAPTRPMREPAPITLAPPHTAAHAPAAAPPVAATPGPAATSGAGAKDGDCWRLQIAAPTERARAQEMQSAAQSQLLVPMATKFEGKRWKVRTRDCMNRESAERLKARATASGFAGVFLVHTAAGR